MLYFHEVSWKRRRRKLLSHLRAYLKPFTQSPNLDNYKTHSKKFPCLLIKSSGGFTACATYAIIFSPEEFLFIKFRMTTKELHGAENYPNPALQLHCLPTNFVTDNKKFKIANDAVDTMVYICRQRRMLTIIKVWQNMEICSRKYFA